MLVAIGHIFLTGPLLIYVGLMKPTYKPLYWCLFAFGLAVLSYIFWHMIKHGVRPWLLVHVLVLIPVLLWVSWQGPKAPTFLFSLLIAFGSAAIGYHLIRTMRH